MDTFALIIGIFAAIAILALIKANRDTRHFLALESHKLTEEQTFPLISIIVTARNEQTHLESSIQGLLAQDYPKFEIIIIDDGSTDDTAKVASSYGSSVRYVYQDNSGLPASRNFCMVRKTGLRSASAEGVFG